MRTESKGNPGTASGENFTEEAGRYAASIRAGFGQKRCTEN